MFLGVLGGTDAPRAKYGDAYRAACAQAGRPADAATFLVSQLTDDRYRCAAPAISN